jgi:hypothetical protein
VKRPDLATVTVYRGEEAVFAKDSLTSFSGKPVTVGHPGEVVTAKNWKDHAVGQIGEEIVRDGEAVRVSLALMDAKAIEKVRSGTRQLSVGYRADLEWIDGVAPDGTPYQARQKNIVVDHLAVVDAARAGPDFRIGDGADHWGATPLHKTADTKEKPVADALRTVVVGDEAVETTDQGARVIERLKTQLSDAETKHASAIQAKDGEVTNLKKQIETKDGEIAGLKKQVEDGKLKPADLAKLVKDRAQIVADAKKAGVDEDTDDMTDAEIKRKAVGKKLGDEAIKEWSDDAVNGAFATLVKTGDGATATDPLRSTGGIKTTDGAGTWGDSAFKRAGVQMKKEA